MKDCEKLKKFSEIIELKLKDYSESKCKFDELISIASFIYEHGSLNHDLPEPCLECTDCYDFAFYCRLLFNIINKKIEINELKKQLQYWEITKANDLILDNFPNQRNKFYMSNSSFSGNKTVYFDFNIFDIIEKKELINEIQTILNYVFVYSPIHLEEVYRMQDEKYQKTRISTISKVTKNHVVLNMDKALNIYIEEPEHSYQRVLNNLGISAAFENKRVVKKKDREIFFKENFDDDFIKAVNNYKDIFNEISNDNLFKLLFFAGCSLKIDSFKKADKAFDEILHMIYSLYDTLDNVAFWREKDKKDDKTVKSSVYDIEHLIYSTFCDFFITGDKRLANRASQIFNFMNLKTKVILIPKEEFSINKLEPMIND